MYIVFSRASLLALVVVFGTALLYWIYLEQRPPEAADRDTATSIADVLGGDDNVGFARAFAPKPFTFPNDHGPHPEYKHEWWYFTGNLDTEEGQHFGFQLTFFQIGLAPSSPQRTSAWATNHVLMAHFTVSDIAGKRFYSFERFSRGAAGLAGASSTPFRVWLEDWSIEGSGALRHSVPTMHLRAVEDDIAIDLDVSSLKPLVLQGEQGLSRKSAEPGNASYYYSSTKLDTQGVITIEGKPFKVSGFSWMDREWSTSALAEDQVGWDWFGLQLSDGRELMFYQLRRRDGSVDPLSRGMVVNVDGSTQTLTPEDISIQVRDQWRSPRSQVRYPSSWRIRIPRHRLDLDIQPYMADQELDTAFRYWEGAVSVTGTTHEAPVTGSGYVELVGYTGAEIDG